MEIQKQAFRSLWDSVLLCIVHMTDLNRLDGQSYIHACILIFTRELFFNISVSGDLLLLICGGGDGSVRIHHCLGTSHHCHQQEKTQKEEEEDGKS